MFSSQLQQQDLLKNQCVHPCRAHNHAHYAANGGIANGLISFIVSNEIWLNFNTNQRIAESLTCSLSCPCPTLASTDPWHFCGVLLSPGRSARALSSSVCTPPAPLWMWGRWGLCWPVDSQAPLADRKQSSPSYCVTKSSYADLWQSCGCRAAIKALENVTEINTHLFTHDKRHKIHSHKHKSDEE